MIYERRSSEHTNHALLADVKVSRAERDHIDPDLLYTHSVAPAMWTEPDETEESWSRRHPSLARVLVWATVIAFAFECAYALLSWWTAGGTR